jgi:hypothetical protein
VTPERAIGPRCNIGLEEIARRRKSAIAMTGFATIVALLLVAAHAPSVARLAILPFAATAAVSWMQVVHRFCVAFGAIGFENFRGLGEGHRVDPVQRAEDRRRASQLILEGGVIGLVVTVALLVIPS